MSCKTEKTGSIARFLLFLPVLLLFGCATTPATPYKLTSDPSGANIYRGTSPDNLKFYKKTPFTYTSYASLGWSNDYFQARKEGYENTEVIQQPVLPMGQVTAIHFPLKPQEGRTSKESTPSNKSKDQIEHLNKLVEEQKRDEIKEILDESPELAQHIKDPTSRLLLTGPRDLRIGRIAKMLEKDFGTSIVVAKINGVDHPYKDFSIEEIELLKELGFNDEIIAAMMNVTNELRRKEQRNAQRRAELAEQKRMLNNSGGAQATSTGGAGGGFTEEAGKAIGKEVGKEVGEQLLDSLW